MSGVCWFLSGVPPAVLQGVASRNELWPQDCDPYVEILLMKLLHLSAILRRAGELKCSSRLVIHLTAILKFYREERVKEFSNETVRDPGEADVDR